MKNLFLFSFLFFHLTVSSQEEVLALETNLGVKFLDITGIPHLISSDSVYSLENDFFVAHSVREELITLSHVKDSIFMNSGGGSVFKLTKDFELDTLIYAPKMETSFFNSAKFIHNDTLISFGGYGNFSFNNSLTYFNSKLKSWSYYPYKTKEDRKPKPGSIYQPWIYSDNVLTVYRLLQKVDGSAESRKVNFLMYQFDFENKSWSLPYNVSKLENLFNFSIAKHYGNDYMIFQTENSFSLFDKKKAMISEYSKTIPLFSNLVSFLIIDDYIFTLNKYDIGFKVFKTPLDLFLNQKIDSYSVIDSQNNLLLILGLSLIILFLLILLYTKYFRKNNFTIIKNSLGNIEYYLSKEQHELLQELVETHPKPVPFKYILSLYDDSIGYEAKKLKTRKTVQALNSQLEKKLDLKNPLSTRRSPSDKRQYEVFLNTR